MPWRRPSAPPLPPSPSSDSRSEKARTTTAGTTTVAAAAATAVTPPQTSLSRRSSSAKSSANSHTGSQRSSSVPRCAEISPRYRRDVAEVHRQDRWIAEAHSRETSPRLRPPPRAAASSARRPESRRGRACHVAPRRPNRPRRSRCQSTGPRRHRRLTTRHVAPRRRTGPRWSSRRPRGGSRRRLRSGAPAPMFHLWPALLIWTYLPRAWLGRRSCRRSIMVGRRWCRVWSVIRGSSRDAGAISATSTHDLGDEHL